MYSEFHSQEESLKAFLAEAQSDRHNSRNANLYKYNNLKIYIDPQKFADPHFIIRIGISESVYDFATGDKIKGGLGADERYVRRWIARYLEKMDMPTVWKEAKKVKQMDMKEGE